jgi:sialate O-acetylesterase
MKTKGAAIIFILAMLHASAFAQLRLPGILSSGMVLQQNDSVQLWGWATPLEKIAITTSWNNQTDTAFTGNDAQWSLKVKTPAAGGPYSITFKGYSTITLTDVLAGEVWVCAGQSNMEWSYYAGVYDMQPELNLDKQTNLRFFHIPKSASLFPQQDVKATWAQCDSNNLKSFSAVAYFFGKQLQQKLHVPIGLINTSWGATPAEVWTPAALVQNDEALKQAAAKQNEKPWCPIAPGVVYNTMIAPVTFFPVAGAIWYQGESNTAAPLTYAHLLTTMVNSWRAAWKKQFPFYMVQIAPFTYGNNYSAALVREQQQKAAAQHRMGMVVITDLVDDTTNIHPKNKKDVGYRLANMALAENYQQHNSPCQSPALQNMLQQKSKLLLSFTGNGVQIKGALPQALMIAGQDKIFYPASAKIQDGKLLLWSKQVKQPVAVRYAFSNAGIGNLFGTDGLPVAPFRTDDWQVQ